MAKNRKKRYKKRNKPYPPLSKLDKGIYSFSLIISVILVYAGVWGIFDIQNALFYRNPDVLAFSSYGSVWAIVPYGIMLVTILILLLTKLKSKRAIFGNKKIDYYNTTRYRFVLPIFDKRYIDRTITKKNVIKVTVKIGIISILFICSCLLSMYSLCHRYEFTQTEINKCNAKGEIVESYRYDSISEYEIATHYHRTAGINSVGFHYLGLNITLPNGECVSPDMHCGLKDIEALYKIDKLLGDAEKTVLIDAENYIDNHTLTVLEESMLREIFS